MKPLDLSAQASFGEAAAEAWGRAHAVRLAGRQKTEDQLQKIAQGARMMIEALNSLQMPEIETLADESFGREQVRPVLASWVETVESVLAAGLGHVPEKQVPQPHKQAEQKLMAALAEMYFDLTGKRPRRSKEKKRALFPAFADAMFMATGIEPLPSNSMVRFACEDLAKKSP